MLIIFSFNIRYLLCLSPSPCIKNRGGALQKFFRFTTLLYEDWIPQANGSKKALLSRLVNHTLQHVNMVSPKDSLPLHKAATLFFTGLLNQLPNVVSAVSFFFISINIMPSALLFRLQPLPFRPLQAHPADLYVPSSFPR